jgi:menaquinone-9 beta-reductase
MQQTDIFISGAGPAGASAALKLHSLGIPCILADKAVFPRDKICGDAISGKVVLNLSRIDPSIRDRFYQQVTKTGVEGIRFIAPNQKIIDIPFKPNNEEDISHSPGFVARRLDFDNFLAKEVKHSNTVNFWEGTEVISYTKNQEGYIVHTDKYGPVQTRLLLEATGAHSSFARKFAGLNKREAHHAAALRVYYSNVYGFHEQNFIELHFLQPILPGYFWVFPLPDGYANVGIGMRSDYIRKKKINLKNTLHQILTDSPGLKERFAHAIPMEKPVGFGLPLGSKLRSVSGDHYMLLGDAGHLIDPLTGEGIGHACYSGVFAAELAAECLLQNNFSASFLRQYDERIRRVIGKEMQLSYRLQQLMVHRSIVNFSANLITKNQGINEVISRMYTDFELRKKLVKPGFWLKVLLTGRV